MEKKEKIVELLIDIQDNRHICTQMSIKYPDPMDTINMTKGEEGDWIISTDQCWVLSGISFCPFCGRSLISKSK